MKLITICPVVGTQRNLLKIYNGTTGSQSLAGLNLVFINGNGGAEYRSVDLSAAGTLAAGQYLVVGPPVVTNAVPAGVLTLDIGATTDAIQNGAPDAVGIFDTVAGQLIDALSYEGSVTAGQINGGGTHNFVEGTELGTGPMSIDAGANGSLSRLPNGSDTDDAATDWAFTSNSTPGVANN